MSASRRSARSSALVEKVLSGTATAPMRAAASQPMTNDGPFGYSRPTWVPRPAPLAVALSYEIERSTDARRITSRVSLALDNDRLCTATIEAVAGDRATLPPVSPRRRTP